MMEIPVITQEHILSHQKLGHPNGFSGYSDKNFSVTQQIEYGLNPKEALNNQQAFLAALSMNPERGWATLESVNSTNILHVTESNREDQAKGFDAAFTEVVGTPLAVCFDDCPIIFVSGPKIVGIIQASRDSLDLGIIPRFFEQISKFTDIHTLKFGVTPYIRAEDYLHPELRMKRSEEWLKQRVLIPAAGGYLLDLKKAITDDIDQYGIGPGKIFDFGMDTIDMADLALKNGSKWCCSKVGFRKLKNKPADLKQGAGFSAIML